MTRIRLPLYLEFLGWAALNLLLIAVFIIAYAPHHSSALNVLLTQTVRQHLISLGHDIAEQLDSVDPSEWPATLQRQRGLPGVVFSAHSFAGPPLRDDGGRFDGDGGPSMHHFGGPHPHRDDLDPHAEGRHDGSHGPRPGDPTTVIIRYGANLGYEVVIPVEIFRQQGVPQQFMIAARASSFWALLRLLDNGRQIFLGALLLLLSALLWWLFVWRITRSIGRLSRATELMARGQLETRVAATRRDELGDLARSVNSMAEHLEAMLSGQRQFVADMAHEITSPVARMQIGVGILEGRLGSSEAALLTDVREDLNHMATMLNEFLLFARSGIDTHHAPRDSLQLRALVESIVAGEPGQGTVKIDVPEDLVVRVHESMLSRALANLIRNARRYGTKNGEPIELSAVGDANYARIAVRDRGPGVPEAAIARLGQPFFRPDLARSREAGGYGLGLAIVKRCILACDGEVIFRNRMGGGFEALISVPLASDSPRGVSPPQQVS